MPSTKQAIMQELEKVDIAAIAKDLRDTLQGVSKLVNGPEVHTVLASANTAFQGFSTLAHSTGQRIDKLTPMLKDVAANMNQALQAVQALAHNIDGQIVPAVADTFKHVDQVAQQANTETLPAITQTLGDARATLRGIAQAAGPLRAALEQAQKTLATVESAVEEPPRSSTTSGPRCRTSPPPPAPCGCWLPSSNVTRMPCCSGNRREASDGGARLDSGNRHTGPARRPDWCAGPHPLVRADADTGGRGGAGRSRRGAPYDSLYPVRLPAYVDRPEIVTWIEANRLHLAELDQWGEPLGDGFTPSFGGIRPFPAHQPCGGVPAGVHQDSGIHRFGGSGAAGRGPPPGLHTPRALGRRGEGKHGPSRRHLHTERASGRKLCDLRGRGEPPNRGIGAGIAAGVRGLPQ